MVEGWQSVVFDEIDVEEITRLSDEYNIKVIKCENRLQNSTAVVKLSKLVRDFQTTMPIVKALGNKLLEDFHWSEIKELLGAD